jgi:hypothetical protein
VIASLSIGHGYLLLHNSSHQTEIVVPRDLVEKRAREQRERERERDGSCVNLLPGRRNRKVDTNVSSHLRYVREEG